MIRLSTDGIVYPAVTIFGRCVVSVLPNDGRVRVCDKAATMTARQRRDAAAWVLAQLTRFGKDAGRTAEQVRAEYFPTTEAD